MSGTRRLLVPGCLTLLALTLVLRVVAVVEPLGIDQGLWASVARGLWRGQILYVDMWDHKPPGIFLTYLAGFASLGWNSRTVVWMDIFASAVTAGAIFATARLVAGRAVGWTAATLYAVLTMPAALYGHGGFLERSVNETFISAAVAAAAWQAARVYQGIRPEASVFLMGLALGAAVVYKPNAGIYAPALVAWLLFSGVLSRRHVALALCGAAILPVLVVLWLWRHGLLMEGWVATIDYNLGYVADGAAGGTSHFVEFAKATWLRMKTEPLWASGVLGGLVAVASVRRHLPVAPLPLLAMIWGAASAVAIYANGAWLFNSYFIQALAPLACLAAWALVPPPAATRARRMAAIAVALVVVAMFVRRDYVGRIVDSASADVAMLRGHIGRVAYLDLFGGYDNARGYSAHANDELAAYLRSHSGVDDRIYVFGISGAEAYFDADRLTAHRFLRVNYFIPGEYRDRRYRIEAVVGDLERARPMYVIFEELHSRSALARTSDRLTDRDDVKQLLQGYTLETTIEDFTLYRRVN